MTISILALKGKLNGKILLLRFFFCRVYFNGPVILPDFQITGVKFWNYETVEPTERLQYNFMSLMIILCYL